MYDVVVIGCGPGGYAASIRAAQLGAKVAVVEAGDIGGTCVNRGCIPSKVWLRAAETLNMIKSGHEFGIEASVDRINLPALVERKNGLASEIRLGMQALLQANGVDLILGRGRLKSAREVDVGSQRVAGSKIILATGSSLDIPDIKGLNDALLTTDQIFDLNDIPPSVLVWGESHLDVEMASLLNSLGSRVWLATPCHRILPAEDHDTSQRLAQALREQGIQLVTRASLEAVEKSGRTFRAILAGRREQAVDVANIVIAARKPHTNGLDLARAGVCLEADGTIDVTPTLQTSVEGIFAVGDITGGWMNSHAASSMGVTAAENALGQSNEFAFDSIPRGAWTFPQVAAVGLTEEAAEQKGLEVEVGEFPYSVNGLAMSYGEVDGAVKIVMEAESREIVGVHIVGAHATELAGEAVMALQLECTVDELAQTIRMHPTFSEGIMDAGRDAAGWALYLPPIK